MTETAFLEKIHHRVADVAVGASALRNQGESGIIPKARIYFKQIILDDFFRILADESAFETYLNEHTDKLVLTFENNLWGPARKGLNLFFRDVVYNRFLADYYHLPTNYVDYNNAIGNLEVPLDSYVREGIKSCYSSQLADWKTIKSLSKEVSDEYQNAARTIAKGKNTARVHLDLVYWRSKAE